MINRKIHRWLSVIGILFFLNVAATGIWLQGEALFGEEEAEQEAAAAMTSAVSLSAPTDGLAMSLDKARAAVLRGFGDRPVAGIDWIIKAPVPTLVVHLDGAAPVKVTVDARSGAILKSEADGESWILRLHTGEILGDGGKALGLAWGLALLAMSVTGILVYLQMLRSKRGAAAQVRGWRRYFW
ncbi:MAG TPA: PepSY domain-containing protein [Novosphingobium sp.]|nr:PepSY domain-containing protein [Novosphingobium sp.]